MLIPSARGASTPGTLVPLHDAGTTAPVRVAPGGKVNRLILLSGMDRYY
jgi:hypothetical protein